MEKQRVSAMKKCPECGFVSNDTQSISFCPCGDEKGKEVVMVETVEKEAEILHGQHFSTENMI